MQTISTRGPALAATLIACLGRAAAGAEEGYCSMPALHGDRLVFVSEGDLWSATIPEQDEPIVAFRLTTSDGGESHPRFSLDGQTIAFTAQYDGNSDVYVMPVDGGMPRRLTFHPEPDIALGWTANGRSVLFRSPRSQPLGRQELYRVSPAGGTPVGYGFGECSMISLSPTGRRFAFTRWSNESWSWKRYRGGRAPEIWIGDLDAVDFTPLTEDRANDMFPMWVVGRVFFLSDRTGTANIFSDDPEGGDLRQHTTFAPVEGIPDAIEGYDVRWPSADTKRRGAGIVFCQAGGLALMDARSGAIRRLDVRLASDRVALRERFTDPMRAATSFALSPDGKRLVISARGELLTLGVDDAAPLQITHTPTAREWGASYVDDEQVVMITDVDGEQQIGVVAADATTPPAQVTEDREVWLFPPVASPDGRWLAFGDKTLRLHVLDLRTLERRQADASVAGEITDYRFSPDSNWLAYARPMPNGMSAVFLYSLRTQRTFPVSDGLHDDREPRWDPAGRYLYFLSLRRLDPMLGELDMEHVYEGATRVVAVPLDPDMPPPVRELAQAAGVDMAAWAKAPEPGPDTGGAPEVAGAEQDETPEPLRLETEGIGTRQHLLAIEAGRLQGLEAVHGGVLVLEQPRQGLLGRDWRAGGLGEGKARLVHHDLLTGEPRTVASSVSTYVISPDLTTVAWPKRDRFVVRALAKGDSKEIVPGDVQLRTDVRAEWRQILQEAWRLQRDFYWAENMVGVDWPAMRQKYEALLPRVGTRSELNDLIGQMIGELGTSHTYVFGGDPHDALEPVAVGLLGADIELVAGTHTIKRVFPNLPWDERFRSPLGLSHLGISADTVILAVNGVALTPASNIHDALQGQADRYVHLTVADDAAGTNRRRVQVKPVASERTIRYVAWVEANRRYVAEASEGRIGYVHLPDMGGEGLSMFSRLFYPQFDHPALVVDVRDNNGGFVSQMVLERLARQVLAFTSPRHGV
ncbi:MAG: S41 family peptidase, partial [Planctomycetota bacterium]